MDRIHNSPLYANLLVIGWVILTLGCQIPPIRHYPVSPGAPAGGAVARELEMVTYPVYTVAAPDILLIDAVRVVPKSPYKIKELDIVHIFVAGAGPTEQVGGIVQVQPDGSVSLGPGYGSVRIANLTSEEAAGEIKRFLQHSYQSTFDVSVGLEQSAGAQPIVGQHVVGPDGTVNLGTYGSVFVAGLTLAEVKEAIEEHLADYLDDPVVAIDILAYNSKWYYIIREGGSPQSGGDQVLRLPATGNETVLDALALVQGFTQMQSKNIWIARPAPDGVGCDQILPVDYAGITRGGTSVTNYQILPRDRIYIAEDEFRAMDAFIDKVTAPVERVFGFTLLGSQTIQNLNRFPLGLQTQAP